MPPGWSGRDDRLGGTGRDLEGWDRVRRDVVAGWEPSARPAARRGVDLPTDDGVATIIPTGEAAEQGHRR